MLIGAVALSACNIIPEDPDGPGKHDKDTTNVNPSNPSQPGDSVDWSDVTLPEGAINVAQAREIASNLASGAIADGTYYVYGVVKKFGNKHESGMSDYGNATFYMADKLTDKDDFEAYQVYNLNKQKYTSLDQIAVGDRVILCCQITNYDGTYETTGRGASYVFWSDNENAGKGGNDTQTGDATVVSIEQAIAIANALEPKSKTAENYRIENVTVDTIFTSAANVTQYGNINLRVKDATGATITCYYTNDVNNQRFTSATQMPKIGATVTIEGPLKLYVNKDDSTTPEFENAWFVSISERVGGEEPTVPEPTPTADTIRVAGAGASPETIDFGTNPFGLSAETGFAGVTPVLYVGEIEFQGDGSNNATSGTKISQDLYKMYKNTTIKLTAPAGKNITSVVFSDSGSNYSAGNITCTTAGYDTASKTWTGSANSLTFSNTAQVRITKLVVSYE